MSSTDKVREIRLRRTAERQGLILQKSRRRDPRAIGFGTYQLVEAATNTVAVSGGPAGFGLTLDEIEAALSVGRSDRLSDHRPESTGSHSEKGRPS